MISQSVDQYFNKVMPNDNRIELKDIFTILRENQVVIKVDENKEIPYTELKDFEIRLINYGINQVQLTKDVFKNNTRSFVQYLAKKREIYSDFYKDIEFKERKDYKKYQIRDDIDESIKSLSDDLYQTSLILTQNFYHFSSDYDKQQLSKMLMNDVKAFKENKIDAYQVFLGDFFQNEENRKKEYLKLEEEVLNEKLFIVKNGLVDFLNEQKGSVEYIVPRLFTHDDYYSSSSSTRFHFFTGKFIEFIMFSISHDFENDNVSIKLINEIINKKPYNMKFHSNNYLEEIDENIAEEEEVYPKEFVDNNSFLDELKKWNRKVDKLKINTVYLHGVLNKFFNNLNVLKGTSLVLSENEKNRKLGLNVDRLIENNTPWQLFQRVVIIFINAVASLENELIISHSNIATSTSTFDFKNFKKTSQVYRTNIEPLLRLKNSFVSLLLEHPIIQIILKESLDNTIQRSIKFKGKKKTYVEIRNKYFTHEKQVNPEKSLEFYNEIKKDLEYLDEYRRKSKTNKIEKKVAINLEPNEL